MDIPETINFNFDVKPILSDRCFACHGPDGNSLEADLRLDTEEGIYAALGENKDRNAVVPGKPGKSELYKRITSGDPDFMMPPPESHLELSEKEIAIVEKWIDQGAEWEPHWSFIPPEKPEIPDVKDETWPETPIDYFVLGKLEDREMNPSPEAAKEALIRRVSFDLTGLPPSIAEVDDFLADTSENAYEKVVDRLLESKAYGERMALDWLDVARYADSHGYQDDGPNEMWPWRDWVISAFNRNMSFDQFTTWQLAGDLLPDATREQKLATGFNRVHRQNQEGGIVGEEYRVEYVRDRANTTGTAFLGLTMECAACHDHKYDPISIKEYYEFSAFFNNVNEAGQIPNEGASGPTILLPDSAAEAKINYLDEQIAEQERHLEETEAGKIEEFERWQKQQDTPASITPSSEGLVAHLSFDDIRENKVLNKANPSAEGEIEGGLEKTEGKYGGALEFRKGDYINLKDLGRFERTEPFSFSFWVNPSDTSEEAPVLVKTGSVFIGYRGYDISLQKNHVSVRLIHGWPYNSIQIKTSDKLPRNQWSHLAVTYDGSSESGGIGVYVNGVRWRTDIEHDNLFKSIEIDQDTAKYKDQRFLIGQRQSFEEINYEGLKLDEVKVYNRQLSKAEVLALADSARLSKILARSPEERSKSEKNILYDHYLLHLDPDYRKYRNELNNYRAEKNQLTSRMREVMVMGERLNPRQAYVLERGSYANRGEKVSPGVPDAVLEYPDDLPKNRLGLARWIVSDENPLTARVMVNRYWQMFFGTGLVDTPGDFGTQGSLPTHPELLDWLAVTFRENGWDVKAIQKQIVMSRAYKQSSVITPELLQKDPQNRLIARGPRYRLPAEMIRDNALKASGLLVDKIGGPSVKPYQPEGLWKELTSGRHLTEYVQDHGDSLYRRSLYTFWKRTSPPPMMTSFDVPTRGHASVERQETSTPIQALFTLNDPQFVEASRMLAERMVKEGGDNLKEQIAFAFKAATARHPDEKEVELLQGLYTEELKEFEEKPERADELLQVGEYPRDEDLDPHDLAAKTIVCNTILNLDETLTKE
ncbi:DUF1553 domain-containing protein [Fodinibius sp.]|uniref:DUF1553 domain-containing protein n=1 Tax=Fodinibius sp. TaxID=1872440 RepID=UPI003562DAAB